MGKNLIELDERTVTANTDFIHVNSGGVDKDFKQTKENFLQGELYHTFANDSLLTDQVDALPSMGTYIGRIASYGAQDATGAPINSHGYVFAHCYTGNYKLIRFISIGDGREYVKTKSNGTWSGWREIYNPTIPNYWAVYGNIIKSNGGQGTAELYGRASIVKNTNNTGLLEFEAHVVTAGTKSSVYDIGISVANLQSLESNLPSFRFLNHGHMTYYKSDGTINTSLQGYTGVLMITGSSTATVLGRLYQIDGNKMGQWADDRFTSGMFVKGSIFVSF